MINYNDNVEKIESIRIDKENEFEDLLTPYESMTKGILGQDIDTIIEDLENSYDYFHEKYTTKEKQEALNEARESFINVGVCLQDPVEDECFLRTKRLVLDILKNYLTNGVTLDELIVFSKCKEKGELLN